MNFIDVPKQCMVLQDSTWFVLVCIYSKYTC